MEKTFGYKFISDEDYITAEKNGINKNNVHNRVYKLGWNILKAISTPVKKYKKSEYELTKEQREIAYRNGILRQTLEKRLQRGMSIKQAITMPTMAPAERAKLAGRKSGERYKSKNGRY